MSESRAEIIEECKRKLVKAKADHLQTLQHTGETLAEHVGGDDGDIAHALEDQAIAVSTREKVIEQLKEINEALERIEQGTYGVCEETEEEIESERLRAIPWTRLSLEGALVREREQREARKRGA